MAIRLVGVVVAAVAPAPLARFWAAALGWDVTVDRAGQAVVARAGAPEWGDGGAPRLTFAAAGGPKADKNRVHLDLVSVSVRQQRAAVERLSRLGATPVDIGQRDVPWVVLADPEANEFCVLEPREEYRGIVDVAAVVVDCADPQALARFWSPATGWPADVSALVASLRHPTRPSTRLELLAAGAGRTGGRLRVAVAADRDDGRAVAVARLERAGARTVDVGPDRSRPAVLTDPEGHEFCLLGTR